MANDQYHKGMSNQEVMEALRYCAEGRFVCDFCPAFEFCDMDYEKVMGLAANRMQDLMIGNERLKKKAANAVEVVRCKDCKHWGTGYIGETEHVKECEFAMYMVGENGYCVYGEKKEEDHED